MKKTPKVEIERSVQFDTETPHPLLTAMSAEDIEALPELTAVGIYKVPDSPYYVSFKIKSKGGLVTHLKVEEPNIRQVAEESAKIDFVNEFMNHV